MRRKAQVGDWIVGTGGIKNVGNDKLIYAMKITEIMSFNEYWNDSRFAKKKPEKGIMKSLGDNIYYKDEKGDFCQYFPSKHSYNYSENPKTKSHDLSGKNVLISNSGQFWYFGRQARKIPDKLSYIIKKGPNHKCKFSKEEVVKFLRWIKEKKPGLYGKPFDYTGHFTAMPSARMPKNVNNINQCAGDAGVRMAHN